MKKLSVSVCLETLYNYAIPRLLHPTKYLITDREEVLALTPWESNFKRDRKKITDSNTQADPSEKSNGSYTQNDPDEFFKTDKLDLNPMEVKDSLNRRLLEDVELNIRHDSEKSEVGTHEAILHRLVAAGVEENVAINAIVAHLMSGKKLRLCCQFREYDSSTLSLPI